MKYVKVTFMESIGWMADPSDAIQMPLPGFEGFYLLNPLLGNVGGPVPEHDLHFLGGGGLKSAESRVAGAMQDDGRCFIALDTLTFVDENPGKLTNDHGRESRLKEFLRRVRLASKQATMPINPTCFVWGTTGEKLPPVRFPKVVDDSGFVLVRKYALDTSVTSACVSLACSEEDEPPLYEEIALDSVRAHNNSDHKTAIIYAAIAIESAAWTIIENEQQRSNPDSDPIFSLLKRRSREFKELLHQLPLYVLKKSLLLEDQTLYDKAIKLYKTRNALMHRGSTSHDVSLPRINANESKQTLEVARSTLKWFDSKCVIPIPASEFVECKYGVAP